MPAKAGAGTAAEARPPRYDDIVGTQTDDAAPAGVTRVQSAAPASATRGNVVDRGSFRTEATEDFANDPDRRTAKPRVITDLVSRVVGLDTAYTTAASFDWCRDSAMHRMAFSRRYTQGGTKPDILVDLFANEMLATQEEVAFKQAKVREHNITAAAFVKHTLEMVEERILAAVEKESALTTRVLAIDGPPMDLEARVAAAQADALLYLRREGLVPFGYVPLVGIPRGLDVAALLAGGVLDIPPR